MSKWWRRYADARVVVHFVGFGVPAAIAWLSNGRYLVLGLVRQPIIVVCLVVHDRCVDKVLCQRRRLGLPLQAGGLPRILPAISPYFSDQVI